MNIEPIGILHTPFTSEEGTPIQPGFADNCEGEAILDESFSEGLAGLDGFSHVWLIYGFHQQDQTRLTVKPFMADIDIGVFATRAPVRPNKLGLSLLKLLSVEANRVRLSGLDMLDGSPLFDLKPFIGKLEIPEEWKTGWLDEAKHRSGDRRVADRRFCQDSENQS